MFKKFWRYKAVSLLCFGAMVLVAGGVVWAFFSLRSAGGSLIVHYNDFQGINRVGGVGDIIEIGILGLVIIVLNFLLSLELERRDSVLGKIVAASSLFLSVLIFIGFAAIISVN